MVVGFVVNGLEARVAIFAENSESNDACTTIDLLEYHDLPDVIMPVAVRPGHKRTLTRDALCAFGKSGPGGFITMDLVVNYDEAISLQTSNCKCSKLCPPVQFYQERQCSHTWSEDPEKSIQANINAEPEPDECLALDIVDGQDEVTLYQPEAIVVHNAGRCAFLAEHNDQTPTCRSSTRDCHEKLQLFGDVSTPSLKASIRPSHNRTLIRDILHRLDDAGPDSFFIFDTVDCREEWISCPTVGNVSPDASTTIAFDDEHFCCQRAAFDHSEPHAFGDCPNHRSWSGIAIDPHDDLTLHQPEAISFGIASSENFIMDLESNVQSCLTSLPLGQIAMEDMKHNVFAQVVALSSHQ